MKNSIILLLLLLPCAISLSADESRPRIDLSFEDDPALEWLSMDPKLDRAWTPTQMDSIVNANMSAYNIPGVVALVTKDNEVVWKGEYGWANVERGIPATDTTVFILASISKTFVANAAMQLWENGALDLDTDINTYLPFSVENPFFPDSIITMRMLLAHTSTIAREDSVWINRITWGTDSPIPLGDYLEDYLDPGGALYDSANYLNYAPGTHYQYSNHAFALAGYIVELIEGSFEQYCQDSLFAPLNMNETSWFLANLDTNNIAMPYGASGAPLGHHGIAIYPCAQIRTSARQLIRHMFAFMNYGELDGTRILDSATVAEMRTWQFPDAQPGQGIGWAEYIGGYWDNWGHGGSLSGCKTSMFFDPVDRTGFVVLTNGTSADGKAVIQQALRAFSSDRDMDGIVAGLDNCPDIYNPGQADADLDGTGDACDCSEPRYSFTGEAANDWFGWRVSGAGDINGDGYDDVIVGAHYNDEVAGNAGKAYVYSGVSGMPLLELTGESYLDNFGESVASAGDVNHDGYDDIIVGAYANSAADTAAGRAYVFHGGPGPYPRKIAAADADRILTGEALRDNFGWVVCSIDDLDGDSCSELVIGAMQAGIPLKGKVYVYSGQTGNRLYTFEGEAVGDWFGYTVAPAGDVNNDGLPDIIVGALYNAAAGTNAGRAYVFYSGNGPFPVDRAASSADQIYTGGTAQDVFGGAVACAGDLNNDDHDDVIVGAPGADVFPVYSAGKAYVFSGATGDALLSVSGPAYQNLLGWSVAGVGDVNGDGVPDVAAGAPNAYENGMEVGKVFVYSGLSGEVIQVFKGEAEMDRMGRDISAGYDFDGDGVGDLIVGAHRSAMAGTDAGRAHVFSLGLDPDADGIQAGCDICPGVADPGQLDTDGDGMGDTCDVCAVRMTGDLNFTQSLTSADIIAMVGLVFKGAPPPEPCWAAADFNCSGDVTSSDIISIVNHVFKGGNGPCNVCKIVPLLWDDCPY